MKLRQRLAAAAAAMLLGVVTAAVVAPAPAAAHGATMVPGSRTWLCFQDGLRPSGEIIAFNPACAAAIAAGGTQPLYDWFAVLRSDAAGRTTGFIPDGQICGAGLAKYAAYNAMRSDWPLTHLTSGANIQFRHSNWAAHPGSFVLYVTKNGWNPAAPLAWSDLESFGGVANPPQSGGPGAFNFYFWNGNLPSGRTGRHMIVVHWIRSDSQENFYSCSDVVFDGGNGEVTGVGPDGGGGPTPPPPPPPTTPPPTTPAPPPPPPPSGNCTATWAIVPTTWPGHFQVQVTVRNTSTANLNGWTVRWSYTGGQTFEGPPWNGVLIGQPPNVVIGNAAWNSALAPNATTSFGFNAAGTAPSPAPTLTCSSP